MDKKYKETTSYFCEDSYDVKHRVSKLIDEGWDILAVIPKLISSVNTNGYNEDFHVSMNIKITYEIMVGRSELAKELYGN